MAFATAAIAALLATSFFLGNKHGRHPLGDEKRKALWWWLGLIALDVLAAELIVTGAIGLSGGPDDWSGALRGAAVGILGPLSLRSPVRETPIRGRPEPIGFTYVYDRARIWLDDGLDERITRLRRADRQALEQEVQQQGWSDVPLLGLVNKHLTDVKRLRGVPAEQERIRTGMHKAFTLPEGGRLPALIKIVLDERFSGVIDDLKARAPSEDDERCGEELLEEWAADEQEE